MACYARPRCFCSGGRSPMDDQPIGTMNVIPFVDIMLVLLTIVLTTASFIATGRIPVALPQASRSQAEQHANRTIEISQAGDLYLDGDELSLDQLRAKAAAFPPDSAFLIRADKDVALQKFI